MDSSTRILGTLKCIRPSYDDIHLTMDHNGIIMDEFGSLPVPTWKLTMVNFTGGRRTDVLGHTGKNRRSRALATGDRGEEDPPPYNAPQRLASRIFDFPLFFNRSDPLLRI